MEYTSVGKLIDNQIEKFGSMNVQDKELRLQSR